MRNDSTLHICVSRRTVRQNFGRSFWISTWANRSVPTPVSKHHNSYNVLFESLLAEFQALFEKLTDGPSTADRQAAAKDVVEQMLAGGASSFKVWAVLLLHPYSTFVHFWQLYKLAFAFTG